MFFLELALATVLQGQVSNVEDIGVIGIRVNKLWDTISVVHPGTPAEKAGLLKGDQILTVDGKWDGEIDGKPGTSVTLKIRRGRQILEFSIEREALHTLPGLNRKLYKNR